MRQGEHAQAEQLLLILSLAPQDCSAAWAGPVLSCECYLLCCRNLMQPSCGDVSAGAPQHPRYRLIYVSMLASEHLLLGQAPDLDREEGPPGWGQQQLSPCLQELPEPLPGLQLLLLPGGKEGEQAPCQDLWVSDSRTAMQYTYQLV